MTRMTSASHYVLPTSGHARREFIRLFGSAGMLALLPGAASAADSARPRLAERLLILVELKGGNDGLNTLVPYVDPAYLALRPRIGIRRDVVLPLDERRGLHPALEPLMPLWRARELAIIEGVGYPRPNLSHFRYIEIWDTAADSDEYRREGWLARAFRQAPAPTDFVADAAVFGSQDIGPLLGDDRVIALADPEQFARRAHVLDRPEAIDGTMNPALAHILKVEAETREAAQKIGAGGTAFPFVTSFPTGPFGEVVKHACDILGRGQRVSALRLTLNGFDTHQNQPGIHANQLKQLAEGLAALRGALQELDLWRHTLILTYAEFGRRPRENQSNGTDHGTASVHFALGGGVRGGFHGASPDLARLDDTGNPGFTTDYRSLYATALARWWRIDDRAVLGRRFPLLDFVA